MLFQIIITNEVRRDYIVIVTFYPNGCSQFENPEAPDLKKNRFLFQIIFNTFASEFASASNLFCQSASASTKT